MGFWQWGRAKQGETRAYVGSVAVGVARWRAVFLTGFVTPFVPRLKLAASCHRPA